MKIVQTCGKANTVAVNKVLSESDVKKIKALTDKVVCDEKLIEYIVSILTVTRPQSSKNTQNAKTLANAVNTQDVTRYIQIGASPRAGIAILQCAKVHALFDGRSFVLPEDIKAVAVNVLRHRLVLSYEAAADSITADEIISKILDFIPVP